MPAPPNATERTAQPALLNIAAAADYLDISVRQMRDLRARRDVTTVLVGRLVRFRPADLDDYIERNVQPAQPRP